MKQATNPFAPVPLWRRRLPGYAAMGAATIAMAVGLIAMQNARTTVAGTLLPVSKTDAATYGISAVYQFDDGSYRVEGVQKGFQSDVQAAVTIDAEGMSPLWRSSRRRRRTASAASVSLRSSRPSTRARLPLRWQARATP